ncbi:MAG: hypothetical protein AABY68_10005 [Pseudomonadota bacterium]
MNESKSDNKKTNVTIDQLFLAVDNPRHEEVDSEVDAIERLCRSEDIDALARDIARYGINPAERLIVIPVDEDADINDKSSYIVAEGNRRVCALKLLKDPERAPSSIRASIQASSGAWAPIEKIDVVIIRDQDQRDHWLQRIHDGAQGGRGRKPWTAEQKTRFTGSGRNTLAQALMDYAEKAGLLASEERRGRLSHLTRLLGNELVKDALGVDNRNGADDLLRNRPQNDFDLVLRALLQEAGEKSLGSQAKKTAINDYARKLQQLDGLTPTRIEPEPLLKIEQESDGKSGLPTRPERPRHPVHIAYDDEVANALKALGFGKLFSLHFSVCKVNVDLHTPLVAVGIWSFFESLAASIGKNESQAFKDFFNRGRMSQLEIGKGQALNAPVQAIQRIADFGNVTKHHSVGANFNAPQLINDMATLKPLILACAKELVGT